MPSVARSRAWFIRITASHELLTEKSTKMLEWVDLLSILFIGHVGDKTEKEHGHMLIKLNSELQKQSLDVRIKSLFHVKGADYSSKPWDGDDSAGGYMFHDQNYKILCSKGFSDEDIKRFQELNEKTQKVIAVNKTKGMNANVEALVEEFKDDNRNIYEKRNDIAVAFLKRIREGKMYDNGNFKLRAMVEEVLIKSCKEEDWGAYCDHRLRELFK